MTKKRGPGRPRAILAKASSVENAAQRKRLGSLRELQLATRTVNRYKDALKVFFAWMQMETLLLPTGSEAFDEVVCMYIEACWQEGEGRGRAAAAGCALQWKSPHLKGKLKGAICECSESL